MKHHREKPRGWKVIDSPQLARLKADARRVEGLGYTGVFKQAESLSKASRVRIAEAQSILTDVLNGKEYSDKENVKI